MLYKSCTQSDPPEGSSGQEAESDIYNGFAVG